MGELRSNAAWRGGVTLPLPPFATLVALLTVVTARGLAQSLPGSFAGTDQLIRWVGMSADLLSQFCAFAFGVIAIRMMVLVLVASPSLLAKLAVSLSTVATVSAVYASLDPSFHPHRTWLLVMGVSVATLSLLTAFWAAARAEGRGLALTVVCIAASGLAHLFARWLLVADDDPISPRAFAVARILATGAFAAEVLALGVGLAWLLSAAPERKPASGPIWGVLDPRSAVWAMTGLGLALAPALVVAQGGNGWRLLVARTLAAFGVHPDPLVPHWASNLLELLVFVTCALTLLPWRRSPQLRAALALVLLGRASFDVPLGALLVLSGLLAVVPFLPTIWEQRSQPAPSGPRATAAR